ncbi:MAG: hypothetical protein ACJ77A_09090 [Actinomycetota bacterium]
MSDLETKLHDLLQERASRPRPEPQAPPGVVRRARRRQVGTALVSAGTAAAVIGGMVLGVQAFGNGTTKPPQNSAAEADQRATRTVSVDAYGITYPADWALQTVNVAPAGLGPGLPDQPASSDGTAGGDTATGAKIGLAESGPALWIQLSNLYPDHLLDLDMSCNRSDFPATAVVLQLHPVGHALDVPGEDGRLTPAPPFSCADGSRLYRASNRSPYRVNASARVGPDASESDVQALFAAYDSIKFPSGDKGVIGGGGSSSSGGSASSSGTPGGAETAPPDGGDTQSVMTVVAGGTTASGKPWVVLVDASLTSTQIEVGSGGVGYASASASGEKPTPPELDASVGQFPGDDAPVVFGSVVARAARVEVRPQSGDPVDLPLSPAPAVTGIERSYFLAEVPEMSSMSGTVVALDAGGNVVARQEIPPPPSTTTVPPGPATCVKPQVGSDGPAACPFSGDGSTGQETASGGGVASASSAGGGSSVQSGTASTAP